MSEVTFTCNRCPKSFASNRGLKIHIYYHDNKKNKSDSKDKAESTAKTKMEKYVCSICDQKFMKLKEYRLHCKIHSIESKTEAGSSPKAKIGKHVCSLCSKSFRNLKDYKLHSKIHNRSLEPESNKAISPDITVPGAYKCPNCPKTFTKYGTFRTHFCSHINLFNFSCKQCLTSFRSESLLNLHIKHDHLGKLYCCGICNKRFYKHLALQHHRSKHMYQPPYDCPMCGAHFPNISKRLRHIRNHANKCAICRVPVSRKEYHQHIVEVHGKIDDVSIPDSTSEEEISENEENAPGIKSKSNMENIVCSPKLMSNCFICDKRVSRKFLDFHINSHNVYQCSTCSKYFSSELKLKLHQKNHRKESFCSLQISHPIQSSSICSNEAIAPAMEFITNNNLINSFPHNNQAINNKEFQTTQEHSSGFTVSKLPNVSHSNSQSFKIDAVFSAKDLQLNPESGVSSDIIKWSIDLQEKFESLMYPVSQEVCEIIEKTIENLMLQLKNKDVNPNKGVIMQTVERLKNVLIQNILKKYQI